MASTRSNMFEFWDWVGGRYSLWSAIGLSIALYLGMDRFEELLAGAHQVDQHFRTAPFEQNIPVIMGLLGIWYNNFFGAQSHAILPYDQYLVHFPAYFQQGDMESNGKSVTRQGEWVDYTTGPGDLGPARHQRPACLLPAHPPGHQADPLRFPGRGQQPEPAGRAPPDPALELPGPDRGADEGQDARGSPGRAGKRRVLRARSWRCWLPAKTFPGNRPTNSFLYPLLTPGVLGALIALYEHKIFTQGVIWEINSFDQMGRGAGQAAGQENLAGIGGYGYGE